MASSTRPTSPRSHRAEAIRLHAAGQVTEARALLSAAATTTEAASASSSSKAAADDPMSEALAAWCLKFLGRPPPLALREFADTGRGLAAGSAGLCAGDDILAIPLSCVLTSQGRLPSHPLLDGWHEDLRLALALLLEPLRDADGPWARCGLSFHFSLSFFSFYRLAILLTSALYSSTTTGFLPMMLLLSYEPNYPDGALPSAYPLIRLRQKKPAQKSDCMLLLSLRCFFVPFLSLSQSLSFSHLSRSRFQVHAPVAVAAAISAALVGRAARTARRHAGAAAGGRSAGDAL